MFVKFVSISVIIFVLSMCFANSYADECQSDGWRRALKLQLDCEMFREFERCANEIAPNGKATEVHVRCDKLNDFPTELFGAFQNIKSLEVSSPPHLIQRDLLGANQLENLLLRSGQLNMSASTFVNAPKLKAFSIRYTDVAYIDPQAFNGASALKTLILIIKSNATLPETLFDGLTNLQVLILFRYVAKSYTLFSDKDNEINLETLRIPANNNFKLFKLDRGNHTELNAEMFVNFTQLTMLLLQSNRIERIQPYAFGRMNQLILLDLSSNRIEELTHAMLTGLTNLRTADFRYNEIRHIESDAFSSTPQLRRLDLSDNKMVILEPLTLNRLLRISYVDLSHSYLNQSTVDLSWFCNLPNLSYLDLHFWSISKLKKCTQNAESRTPIDLTPEGTPFNTAETAELLSEWQYLDRGLHAASGGDKVIDLAYIVGMNHENEYSELLDESQTASVGGSKLTVLNLGFNRLSDWEDNLFDNFVNLRVLDLDHNPIESLRSGQFSGLGNLLILRLNYCELTSLDFNAFLPLTNLKKLYLSHSRITTITPPEMSMNRLIVLQMGGNYFPSSSLGAEAFRKSFNWDILELALYSFY